MCENDRVKRNQQTNKNMNTTETILAAKTLTYDAAEDVVYADGRNVGGADVMTREVMLSLTDKSYHEDSDEALFDAIFAAE